MQPPLPNSIDEVISALENIIDDSKRNNDALGYFAVLYQKVTKKVKEGIAEDFFEDGLRMEQFDVVFANRYLDAYYSYQNNEPVTESWEKAFELSKGYWPIVLQHLLVGMNAHISLDLGIVAAQISENDDLENLKNDFNKINRILSDLVEEVENDLAEIWPRLRKILNRTGKFDDCMIDFSMELARNDAWKLANELACTSGNELAELIAAKDRKVARHARLISHPGFIASSAIRIIRLGERGSVAEKIGFLKG